MTTQEKLIRRKQGLEMRTQEGNLFGKKSHSNDLFVFYPQRIVD